MSKHYKSFLKESHDNFTIMNLSGKRKNLTESSILYKQQLGKGKGMGGGGLGLWSDFAQDNI
jgi:hypothetical protein